MTAPNPDPGKLFMKNPPGSLKKPPDPTQERIAKALERIADQLEWDSQRRNI
jgi:hypothetical protein